MKRKDLTVGTRVAYTPQWGKTVVGAVTAPIGGRYVRSGTYSFRDHHGVDGVACVADDGTTFGIDPNRLRFVVPEAQHLAEVKAHEERLARERARREHYMRQVDKYNCTATIGPLNGTLTASHHDPERGTLTLHGPLPQLRVLLDRLLGDVGG